MDFVPPPPPMDDIPPPPPPVGDYEPPPPPPPPHDSYGPALASASATRALSAVGPGSPATQYLEVAEGLLQRGDVDGFRDVLEAAVTRRPPGSKFDHVQTLCCLASYYGMLAQEARDLKEVSDYSTRANGLIFDARNLDLGEQLPHLVAGQLALAKRDFRAARAEFKRAQELTCNGRKTIAGRLALANLAYREQDYAEAAREYKQALRECPSAPPEARLGLAACHFKLGSLRRAVAAYERVLQLAPACTPALLGLAVLKMRFGASEEELRQGSQLLVRAFWLDPANSHALVLLAHFCLRQAYHDKAARLAQAALELSGGGAVRAEALAVLARAHHARGQLNDAYRLYTEANSLAADRKLDAPLLPRYGLAQMSMLQGDYAKAAALLEDILDEAPGWTDALCALGVLYPRLPGARSGGPALPAFRAAATRAGGGSAELWELLGDVLAAPDPGGALQAYSRAVELRRKAAARAAVGAAQHLPARLLNNAAVMQLRAGNAGPACALMREALASAAADPGQALGAPVQVTLGYNAARAREAAGELAAAEREYSALLQQFPGYGDCLLRLAAIARRRGDLARAESLAQRAADAPASAADGLALLAALYQEAGDASRTKDVLDELGSRGAGGQAEAYARLAQGNLYLRAAPAERRREEQVRKAEAQLGHAMELYRRVLEKDEGNVYAANGVGCVLAEVGDLDAARDAFLAVQEAASASAGFERLPDAWVNLANVHLAQEQYTAAAKMYDSTLRRFYGGRSATLALYLARALYDADRLPEARRALARALHLAPGDARLQFNAGLTMQEWAVRVLRRERPLGDPSRLPEFRAAVGQLERAHRLFLHLTSLPPGAGGVDRRKLETHVNFVAETHAKAQAHVRIAEREEAEAEQRRGVQRQKLLAAQREREAEEERRREEAAALERHRREQAAKAAARAEALKREWREAEAQKKAAEKGEAAAVARAREQEAKARADADAYAGLFDDEEGDEDYNPDVPDPEFAHLAPAAGGAPAGGESPAMSGEDADLELERELEEAAKREEAEEAEDAALKHERSAGPRLKRRRAGDVVAEEAAGPTEIDEDAVAEEDVGGASARKRARAVVASDSEDE